jgi:acetylornithine deacetylase/succinyl-diaminopimelate desuccinylase-like protein
VRDRPAPSSIPDAPGSYQFYDAEGRVRIPGFYDGVEPVPPALASAWGALAFDESGFLADIGLTTPAGEAGLPALERLWARPTADINGLWGGYSGPGSKTVIPAEAHAKISFRLVPGQQPAKVIAGFERFLEARRPADAEITCTVHSQAPGIEIPAESRWMRAAQAALAEEYGREAVMIGSGGSIPVVDSLRRVLGIDSLLLGFGLADDQAHSPDEKFELRCFRHGIRAHARLLARCAA